MHAIKRFLILGLLAAMVLMVPGSAVPLKAADAPPPPSPILVKCLKYNPYHKYADLLPPADKASYAASDFEGAFDKGNLKYHNFVECLFDESVSMTLGVINPKPDEDPKAKWNTPKDACLKPVDLKKAIDASSPGVIVPQALAAYAEYRDFLAKLKTSMDGKIPEAEESPLKERMDQDVQDALLGLDAAVMVLKEMRMAMVMHVGFECMLDRLDKYRQLLSNIRSLTTYLPDLLEDAAQVCH